LADPMPTVILRGIDARPVVSGLARVRVQAPRLPPGLLSAGMALSMFASCALRRLQHRQPDGVPDKSNGADRAVDLGRPLSGGINPQLDGARQAGARFALRLDGCGCPRPHYSLTITRNAHALCTWKRPSVSARMVRGRER